LKPYR